MANLYLVDAPFGRNGLALAASDDGARVVLIQDGVYLDVGEAARAGARVFAVANDVVKRGLNGRLPDYVELIDYGRLVDLIVEHKVLNFV